MTLGAAHWKEEAMAGVTTRLLRASALAPGTTPQPVVISHRAGLIRYTYCMHKGSLSLMLYAQRSLGLMLYAQRFTQSVVPSSTSSHRRMSLPACDLCSHSV